MVITYYGVEFFKVQFGDLVIAYNPIAKSKDGGPARFGADIALVSMNHPHFNGVKNLSHGDKKPFVISGAGEYETKGIFVKGFNTEGNYDGKAHINTIYKLILEGMSICFLGALDRAKLDEKIYESLGKVDILLVPIGGNNVLTSQEAYKLSLSFSPHIIIPMHFLLTQAGDADSPELKTFLNEAGGKDTEQIDKLTLKKKDLEGKEGEIVVLKQQ